MPPLPAFPNRSILSRRQKDVISCLVHGMSNKETARELNISPRTVEDHRMHACQKLGVRNVTLLIRYIYNLDEVDHESQVAGALAQECATRPMLG